MLKSTLGCLLRISLVRAVWCCQDTPGVTVVCLFSVTHTWCSYRCHRWCCWGLEIKEKEDQGKSYWNHYLFYYQQSYVSLIVRKLCDVDMQVRSQLVRIAQLEMELNTSDVQRCTGKARNTGPNNDAAQR